ncbi:MAG: DNA polymerase III subunit delta [SAR202 cluster bacterium]|nr:DNA polymerase III subunit delta [SAR202 cluster bacterium]
MIIVLEGKDEYRLSERVSEFRLTVTPPEMSDINTTRLDGNIVTIEELLTSLTTVPFMADRRLVIVEGLLNRLGGSKKDLGEWLNFPDLLKNLPPTANLLLIEREPIPSNKLLSTILRLGQVEKFSPLRHRDLLDWINTRCSKLGLDIERTAVALIADSVGSELRLIDSELNKIKTYSRGRLITREDITLMVPYVRQQNVFRVVDSVIEGRTRDALNASSMLIELGESPSGIVRMIERQLRFLILAKHLLSRKIPTGDIGKHINLSGYPLQKTLEMERKISQARIMSMHDNLLKSNIRVREGKLTEQESFDLLISELR